MHGKVIEIFSYTKKKKNILTILCVLLATAWSTISWSYICPGNEAFHFFFHFFILFCFILFCRSCARSPWRRIKTEEKKNIISFHITFDLSRHKMVFFFVFNFLCASSFFFPFRILLSNRKQTDTPTLADRTISLFFFFFCFSFSLHLLFLLQWTWISWALNTKW